MSRDIHPITPAPGGTVPASARPYRPPRRRLRRVAAGVAAALALGAGGIAVLHAPLHDGRVATVFSATQGPDDDTTVPSPPQRPERAHADVGGAEDD